MKQLLEYGALASPNQKGYDKAVLVLNISLKYLNTYSQQELDDVRAKVKAWNNAVRSNETYEDKSPTDEERHISIYTGPVITRWIDFMVHFYIINVNNTYVESDFRQWLENQLDTLED